MAGVAFAVEGDGVGFATESYAASALYTTLANLSAALWRIRRVSYGAGASTETVGAKQICMNVLPMPPGAKAKVHYHKGIETIAYLLEGECAVYYGDELEYRAMARAGDQVYLPEDVPHAPYNQSTALCKWLVVHSSGSDQDGIVLLPELDLLLAKR
jgi:uncharacterized RmlC-like cupin family protein